MRCIQSALLVACVCVCLTACGRAELQEDPVEAFRVRPGAVVGGVGGLVEVPQEGKAVRGDGGGGACKHLEAAAGEICAKQGAGSSVCQAVQRARHTGCAAAAGKEEASIGEDESKSSRPPPSSKEKLKDLWQEANELSVKHVTQKEEVRAAPSPRLAEHSADAPACVATPQGCCCALSNVPPVAALGKIKQ